MNAQEAKYLMPQHQIVPPRKIRKMTPNVHQDINLKMVYAMLALLELNQQKKE